MVAAGKAYPGVRCFDGERDPFLVEQAQWCADRLAARGIRAYAREGHPEWERRYHLIRQKTGLRAQEVSVYNRSLTGLYRDWAYGGTTHWLVISKPHARYGEGLARARDNVLFGVIITAD